MDAAPPKLTDSPWFWAYSFTMFGLIALAVMNPKFTARQTQIERQYQGRQHSIRGTDDQASQAASSSSGRTIITLQPLFVTLAALTTTAWIIFWQKCLRQRTV